MAVGEKRSAGPSYPFQFKANMLPPHPTTTRAPIFYKRNTPQAMTEAQSLPLGVPAFKPLRTATNIQSMVKRPGDMAPSRGALHQYPAPHLAGPNSTFSYTRHNASLPRPGAFGIAQQGTGYKVPAFHALPASVSRISSSQATLVGDTKKSSASNVIESGYSTIQRSDVRIARAHR